MKNKTILMILFIIAVASGCHGRGVNGSFGGGGTPVALPGTPSANPPTDPTGNGIAAATGRTAIINDIVMDGVVIPGSVTLAISNTISAVGVEITNGDDYGNLSLSGGPLSGVNSSITNENVNTGGHLVNAPTTVAGYAYQSILQDLVDDNSDDRRRYFDTYRIFNSTADWLVGGLWFDFMVGTNGTTISSPISDVGAFVDGPAFSFMLPTSGGATYTGNLVGLYTPNDVEFAANLLNDIAADISFMVVFGSTKVNSTHKRTIFN